MKKGKVIPLICTGKRNKIYKAGETVNESQFDEGEWDRLIREGFIKPEDPKEAKNFNADVISEEEKQREAEEAAEDMKAKKKNFKELMNSGRNALRSKKYEDAVQAFTKALEIFPEETEAVGALNQAQSSLNDQDKK